MAGYGLDIVKEPCAGMESSCTRDRVLVGLFSARGL